MYGTINTIFAYLISLGIIGAGVAWIVVGVNSTLYIGIGIASIVVGAVSLFKELRHRTHKSGSVGYR
jgi:multidrug transporter EmrE-like cation transporter